MKLTSAIIMFMLAIATLVIGVLAAQTQSINMEGTINFEISDRSLYVKNVRLEDSDGREIPITSFMPGYINDGITLSLGSHTVSNTSFKIHFDLINTTSNTYEAGDVTLSSELQTANVIATASGMIEPTTEDIPEGENYAPITDSTPISGTITLFINSPNTTSIDLSGITVAVDEYEPQQYDFVFLDGTLTSYYGLDQKVVSIPSSYSLRNADEWIITIDNVTELNNFLAGQKNAMTVMCGGYSYKTEQDAEWTFVDVCNMTGAQPLTSVGSYPLQIKVADFTIPTGTSMDVLSMLLTVHSVWAQQGYFSDITYKLSDTESVTANSYNFLALMVEFMMNPTSPSTTQDIQVIFGDRLLAVEGSDYETTAVGFGVELNIMDGMGAFSSPHITEVIIPEGVTKINSQAFGYSAVSKINIPTSVTEIGNSLFDQTTTQAQEVYYKGTLDEWAGINFSHGGSTGDAPLENTSTLYVNGQAVEGNITISSNISDSAFANLDQITGVTITEGVTSIGRYAFENCSNITQLSIPNSIEYIGDNAFRSISSLNSYTDSAGGGIYLGNANNNYIVLIDSSQDSITVHDDCKIVHDINGLSTWNTYVAKTVNVSAGVVYINFESFYGQDISSVTVESSNQNYYSSSNAVYSKDQTVLYRYFGEDTSFDVPSTVKTIEDYAFYNCTTLTSVNIAEGVTNIGDEAFWGCTSLASLSIPSSIEFMGGIMSSDVPVVSGAGNELYLGNSSNPYVVLQSLTYQEGVSPSEYVVNENCRLIYSFDNGFTSLVIPESVVSIGPNALEACTSLQSITIESASVVNEIIEMEMDDLTKMIVFLMAPTLRISTSALSEESLSYITPYFAQVQEEGEYTVFTR